MDLFKKFLKGKKVDKHFKKSGDGAKLGASSSRSSGPPTPYKGAEQGGRESIDRVAASDIAAQAAYKRILGKPEPKLNYSQKKIQLLAKQELERERAQREEQVPTHTVDEREFEHNDMIKGVFYTCELLSDDVALTKPDLHKVIEEFLKEQIALTEDDAIIPAVMLLYTLNKKEIRQTAVETIATYLKNIAEFPDEIKFRKIRMSNRAFKERVLAAVGGLQVLTAVGFKEVMDGNPPEAYLAIPEEKAIETGKIFFALDTLRDGQPVPIKVARDTKAFIVAEGVKVPHPELPPDFFDLSVSEVAREQQLLKEQANRMSSLRTQEMRERDSQLRNYKYKYTLLRVRLPDRLVLQGIFGIYEPLSAVREWIAEQVAHQATPFKLKHVNTPLEDDQMPLGDGDLAPCAVLHLDWVQPVDGPSLKESLLANVQPIDP